MRCGTRDIRLEKLSWLWAIPSTLIRRDVVACNLREPSGPASFGSTLHASSPGSQKQGFNAFVQMKVWSKILQVDYVGSVNYLKLSRVGNTYPVRMPQCLRLLLNG